MGKEERRIEILRAAGRIFYLKGFEGTKMEDIAKEAGIGKGTLYGYFDSKQQLFEQMIAYNRELHIRSIKSILDTGECFREKFTALARYQAELISEHIGIFNAMAYSKVMARELGALFLEQSVMVGELIKKQVIEAVKKGELRSDLDPEIVVSIILGTITQHCGQKIIFYNVPPEDMDFDAFVDAVLKGIE
jgi:AcrR family transcriptional regulator